MLLETKHFGKIEVDESKIVFFEHGIPGFPNDKRYIIVTDVDAPETGYCWLQSVDDGNVSLVLIDSFGVMPEYDPQIEEEELAQLGEVDLNDIIVFSVAVIKADITASTVNLKAPLIINERTKKGKQIVATNDEYTIRHSLAECIKSRGKV